MVAGDSRGQDDRQGHDPAGRRDSVCGHCRAGRSNRLGPADLVVGIADFFFPRVDWRIRRCCHGTPCSPPGIRYSLQRNYPRGMDQDPDLHCICAVNRPDPGAALYERKLLAYAQGGAADGRHLV